MRKSRVFYGWYIVAAGVLINASIGGIIFYGFTAFINPIVVAFGWSYAQISLAMSLRGLEQGALNPLVGIVADRWTPKRLMLIGVGAAGVGLLCLSQMNNLVMFYVSFFILGLGTSITISMVPMTTVARWFKRDVGKASAVISMGVSVGGLFVPVLVEMMDTYGWRTCLVIVAVAVLVMGIPLSLLFRSRPEDYGLLPDGRPQEDSEVSKSPGSHDLSVGVKQALRLRAFWYIGTATMLQMGVYNAVVIHMMPYLASVGMERSTASVVAMSIPLASLAVRLPYGWLADIFKPKYLFIFSIVLTSVGLFIFSLIGGRPFGFVILFIVTFSFGVSGLISLRVPLLREYFGIGSFGTIFGLMSIFTTIGMVVGPPLAGWVFDTYGVYQPMWLISSGACMIGAIIMLAVPSASRSPG